MKFRTELKLNPSDFNLNHDQKIISFGSCFAQEMAQRLQELKFDVLNNPFGILFHPLAIENALTRIQTQIPYTSNEIFQQDELYFSWDHHSAFNSTSEEETLERINNALQEAYTYLQDADVVLLTFGTSWVYKIKELDVVVANCHKVKAENFQKILLSDKQIKNALNNTFDLINNLAPNARIIVSVSPVRHLKDGMVENNVSKSKLITALYEASMSFDEVDYFPAYEFLMDDLRDYRFYADDLLHPSKEAIQYIWEKFSDYYFDSDTQQLNKKIHQLMTALQHRAFNESTTAHQLFLQQTLKVLQTLEASNASLEFTAEKAFLQQKIHPC